MRCKIVTCLFTRERKTRYALMRLFDGKFVDWHDLNVLIPEEEKEDLPEKIVEQFGSDGTALFHSRSEARQVKGVLEGI